MNLLLFLFLLAGLSGQTGMFAHDDVGVCPTAASWTAIGSRSLTYLHPSLEGEPARYMGEPYDPDDPTYLASNTDPPGTVLRLVRFGPHPGMVAWACGAVVDTGSPDMDLDGSEALFQKLGTLAEGRIKVLIFVNGETR